jgi:hypothetical protein
MLSGQDLSTQGPMSSKLFYNLTHYAVPILKEYLRLSQVIAIRPIALHCRREPGPIGVMASFSGGIDSFCNYYDHSGNRAPPEFQITHFVYNNVGSHGQRSPERDHSTFVKRFAILQEFARQQKKPFIMVNSNLDDIVGMNYQLTHTVRNAAVGLLMQNCICKFLYASGYPFRETKIKPFYDPEFVRDEEPRGMACLDPVILPLLGTERLDCIASGGQYTRVEKTACVATIEASARFLDVCVHPEAAKNHINCSRCWKCLRTALTLEVLGKVDQYIQVFDLNVYRRFRPLYLVDVLSSSDYFLQEIRDLMKERNFHVPKMIRLAAAITPKFVKRKMTRRIIPWLACRRRIFTDIINLCLGS